MAEVGYNWKRSRYGFRSSQRYKQSEHFVRWVAIAVALAIICHIIVIIAMNKMPVFLGGDEARVLLASDQIIVKNVAQREYLPEVDDATLPEPPKNADSLLEEMEMLEEIPPEMEVDFSPTVEEPEIAVDMEMPPLKGDELSSSEDLTKGLKMTPDLEDAGSTDAFLKPQFGQILVDAGMQNADMYDPDKFNVELAKGAGGDDENGVLEGFTPLAEMARLSQSDLDKAKGMIGSDLLYEFNKAVLRDSAKNSLMKVVLLLDKNPNMKCWIEGHTDLIGSDEANMKLSLARAQAVKDWLVNSIQIDPARLYVRGFGKSHPIVLQGDRNAQAINRRVEIKMRKNPPPEIAQNQPTGSKPKPRSSKPRLIKPRRNPNKPGSDQLPPIPDATRNPVKPGKAIPVEPIPAEKPPKAIPVEEPPTPTRRTPGKAIPVE